MPLVDPGPVLAAAVPAPPSGPAFDLVLIAHIGCAVVAVATVVVSGVQAERLRRLADSPPVANLASYYRPGVNWAGRSLHLVPLLGVALVAMSQRAFTYGDHWVLGGLSLWVVAAFVAEGVLWPAERRLQVALDTGDSGPASPVGPAAADLRAVRLAALAIVVVLVAAMVVMTAQP